MQKLADKEERACLETTFLVDIIINSPYNNSWHVGNILA